MNVNELREKYQILFAENKALKEENEMLKARLGITAPPQPIPLHVHEKQWPLALEPMELSPIISFQPDPAEKIRLFMSLFKGRGAFTPKGGRTGKAGRGMHRFAGMNGKQDSAVKQRSNAWIAHISLMIPWTRR